MSKTNKTRQIDRFLRITRCALFIGAAILSSSTALRGQRTGTTGPPVLTYTELVQLYENESPSAALQNRLTQLLTTPFVSNGGSSTPPRLSNVLRVAVWNIER